MSIDLLQNLSTYTTTPKYNYNKLIELLNNCITHSIYAGTLENETEFEFDIGLGVLKITILSEEIKYKFIPSESLEANILSALDGKDIFVETLEKKVAERILNTYKEI